MIHTYAEFHQQLLPTMRPKTEQEIRTELSIAMTHLNCAVRAPTLEFPHIEELVGVLWRVIATGLHTLENTPPAFSFPALPDTEHVDECLDELMELSFHPSKPLSQILRDVATALLHLQDILCISAIRVWEKAL